MQLDLPVARLGLEADRAGSVPEGVVDEVAERLLQPDAVADDRVAVGRVHLEDAAVGRRARLEPSGDGAEQSAGRDRGTAQRACPRPRGRDEQVLGEPDEPVDLVGGRAQRAGAPRSSAVAAGRARAPSGGGRAASAGRGSRRPRSAAPARAPPRAGRASRSGSRRAGRSRRAPPGAGDAPRPRSLETSSARRRIASTGRSAAAARM